MLKKRMIIIFIAIVSCCYFFNNAYASNTATVYLSSSQDILEKGEEVDITLYIENVKTAAFNFSLYFDDTKLEYISNLENTNLIENRVLYVWFDSKGGEAAKEGELITFKFRAKENGLATFTVEGEFYSQKGQLINTNFEQKQVQIGKEESILQRQAKEELGTNEQASNSNLQALRIDKEGMVPSFNQAIDQYYLTIPNNIQNIEVLAISENPNATVEITGNTNLQEGLNNIIIRVVSEDKTQSSVYTIQVTKTANLDLANTNLEILAIENVLLNPPFDTTITNYKVEIANSIDKINLLAIPQKEEAHVEISKMEDLQEGNNLITVTVTAPNGFTKKKYQVEVYRRNLEEEKRYQEEQATNKENLENAYKIENLSNQAIDELQKHVTANQNKKYQSIAIWMAIMVVMALVISMIIWKRKHKKQ